MHGEWTINDKGNKVLVNAGEHVATVFRKAGGTWGAIISGRLLIAVEESSEAMIAYVHKVLIDPSSARYVAPCEGWRQSKTGGYYKRTKKGIVSIKQAKSGSWYVTTQDGILPSQENPRWCNTAEEAWQFVDTCYR